LKNFVLQRDQADCGVACLASIIKFHKGKYSLENLRRISGTSAYGTTLLGLQQAARQFGFEAEGMEARSVENLHDLIHPAILHVVVDNSHQHYLVYFPNPEKSGRLSCEFTLGDPAQGIIEMSPSHLDKIWQSKTLLILTPTEKFVKGVEVNRKKFEWIISLLKEDLTILFVSLLLGIAISVIGISAALFSQKLIDEILPNEDIDKLFTGLAMVTLLMLTRSGFAFLRGHFMVRQSMDFNNRIIQRFYNNLLHLPKSFFDTRKVGDLIARMNDTRRIQSVLSAISGSMVIDLLVILVSTAFLFTYSLMIAFWIVSSFPIYFLILIRFNKRIFRTQKEVMRGYATAESNFVDTIQGVADIKLMNKQSFFERVNATVYSMFQQSIGNLGKLNIRFSWATDVTGTLFTIGVFGISSWLVISKDLKVGEMVALLAIASTITPSLNRLVVANVQIQEAMVAFERMYDFTALEKEQTSNSTIASPLIGSADSVKVENLAFRFPGRKEILKSVTMSFQQGQIVALLGESGGGKSTILQLIQKFYDAGQGNIFVNDTDLSLIQNKEWRSIIGSVPQDLKIFNGSLLYNITLSDQELDFVNAITFCTETGFEKYFRAFPQNYQTLLGEEGINLSGGQKQLVVLARTLFRNPKILLLDEATSSMDRNVERFVLDLLQRVKKTTAILFVTHKINTAQQCDKIYILEDGQTNVSGTPEELLLWENFYSISYRELMR
jgi:ATP-binding cassette, subfamily C, bacteriocin exporter